MKSMYLGGIDFMKLKLFATTVAALLVIGILSAGNVSAHAELDRSNPAADATVQGSPDLVEIWFTEEIAEGSKIEVADATGQTATKDVAKLDLFDPDRKHLTVELKPDLPNGVYTVTWTSISAEDGDTESDTFTFTIQGSGTPVASPVASAAASPVGTGTPPASKVSGSLQYADPPKAQKANIDDRALAIALGAGVLAALFIYGFWRLVKPRRHPFDRNPR
jgi:methionine-rich copper-binding protein CopC